MNGIRQVYQKLYSFYGPQNWWPAETPFEVCVGAILTQNTSWKNVERAINNLKNEDVLSPEKILALPTEKLAELIKPSGFYRQKAAYLKNLCRLLVSVGGLGNLKSLPAEEARKLLLNVKGIGRETADSILLYALEKPVFVVDAYTKRLFYRLKLLSSERTPYEQVRRKVEESFKSLPHDEKVNTFNEFHALIVKHCKELCRKSPLCKNCFLKSKCSCVKIGKESRSERRAVDDKPSIP